MTWTATDIEIEIYDGDADMVIATIQTPAGAVEISCNIDDSAPGRYVLRRVHIQGKDVGANKFGWANLRKLLKAVREYYDVDELIVEGAKRTSGANQGETPCPIRVARDGRIALGERPEL